MAYDVGQGAGDIGQILAEYAARSGQGRAQQAGIQQNQDTGARDLYRMQLLNAMNTPPELMHQAMRGDLLANGQNASIGPGGKYGHQLIGGVQPGLLGPNSRQAGNIVSRQALQKLMGQPTGGPFDLPRAPTQTLLPQSSGMDKAAKWGGLLGSLLNGASGGHPITFGGGKGQDLYGDRGADTTLPYGPPTPADPNYPGWEPAPTDTGVDPNQLPGGYGPPPAWPDPSSAPAPDQPDYSTIMQPEQQIQSEDPFGDLAQYGYAPY